MNHDSANYTSMRSQASLALALLLGLHVVVCCLSSVYVTQFYQYLHFFSFDHSRLYVAALIVAPFAVVSLLFIFARFSFGYFVGFYFYTMILGYLWLGVFSKFQYDHNLASVSAFASALAFLAPALFITSPIKQRFVLSSRSLDYLLSGILILAAAIVAAGAFYNFKLVGLTEIYRFRDEIEFPGWLRYATGPISNALLPFAFACFAARGNRYRAAAVLLLLLSFYPITLTKLALFGPFWLLFLTLLSRFFSARTTVVLSLFLPLSAGVLWMFLFNLGVISLEQVRYFFGAINFRMIALPSIALDLYNHFFSTHEHTRFCQIIFLKPFVHCPYTEQLSIVMAKAYQFGNVNASLFATEGIASVGPVLAPLAVLACGLVISLGNRLSASLPPRFILMSGGILPLILLNVPLTTTLLSNGASILFLLWYVTPRTMFEPEGSKQTAPLS
ncbi:hypothetical protein SAMN05444159_6064 [Bradyrhizobium lablabi]|uniref:Uncharacterized protein n=1 Tax=Bradyrhizobium lablabi TaxID=722472 RepID=A0A1M7B6R9_9BRAD|nr:hypothetical protein [Bradyrhizobium lablabi]SHL50715.1 hypothetical protein SAMN05444159_6064 [Bradyrhizobium lablabi]